MHSASLIILTQRGKGLAEIIIVRCQGITDKTAEVQRCRGALAPLAVRYIKTHRADARAVRPYLPRPPRAHPRVRKLTGKRHIVMVRERSERASAALLPSADIFIRIYISASPLAPLREIFGRRTHALSVPYNSHAEGQRAR